MRFHSSLSGVLGNPIRLDILRILSRFPLRGFTGRELARLIDNSPSQTNEALGSLRTEGLVHSETVGRAHLWRFSKEHELARPIRRLFESEHRVLDTVRLELRRALSGLPVERARLFGSVARGDEDPSSDIDVFVEVLSEQDKETVADALARASARFALRFGNSLSNLVLTRAELARKSNPK